MKFNLKLGLFLLLLLIFTSFFIFVRKAQAPQNQVKNNVKLQIGTSTVNAEIAQTQDQLTKGLSGQASLGKDNGMLFVFDQVALYRFWMKDMKFPLDFIWIKDNQVVDLTENVPAEPGTPDSQLEVYSPKTKVNKVLEVNAGFVKSNQIKIGDFFNQTN